MTFRPLLGPSFLTIFLLCAPSIEAQVPECDSLSVSLSATNTAPLTYDFSVGTSGPNYSLIQVGWQYGDGLSDIGASLAGGHIYSYPGNALACVLILAQNTNTLQFCTQAACTLVDVSPTGPIACDTLQLDYLVEFDSGLFTFYPQVFATDMGLSYAWVFGDGATASGFPVSHVYGGTGPYEACLTVTGTDSLLQQDCSRTVCHWIYFGPDTIPCSDVVSASFNTSLYDSWAAFVNTSTVSGMSSEATWDFGDGEAGTGDVAVHHYAVYGDYQACLTQRAWGPLAVDTCEVTTCAGVSLVVVGVENLVPGGPLQLSPMPFHDDLRVDSGELHGPVLFQLFDAMGRLLDERTATVQPSTTLDYQRVPAGQYVLRATTSDRVLTARVVKL